MQILLAQFFRKNKKYKLEFRFSSLLQNRLFLNGLLVLKQYSGLYNLTYTIAPPGALKKQVLADKAKDFTLHLFYEVLWSESRPSAFLYLYNLKQWDL